MKSRKNEDTNQERRKFLGASITLASGIIITPLYLTACGGDNQGDGRTTGPKKKRTTPPSGDGSSDGTSDGGPAPGQYKVVDPSALGSKQTVKVAVNYKGEHIEWTDPRLKQSGLTGDDGVHAMGQAKEGENLEDVLKKYYPNPNPLGTKYVVQERVITIKDGDKTRLCNCFVVLAPRGPEQVAKNPRDRYEALNQYFRFEPRCHDIAKGGHVTWLNSDPVNHAINTNGLAPAGPGPTISNGGTVGANAKINTEGLGFIKPGYYGAACSLHGWELGRIFCSDHAYVAVTDAKNKCIVGIDNVADGKYELQVWHESSNSPVKTQEVEVKAGMAPIEIDIDKIA